MDALETAPVGMLVLLYDLISNARLMGSRGRARAYGRPDPEGVDWDWIIYTDEPELFHIMLRSLAEDYGFKLHERDDGTVTASGHSMDISTHPTWKRAWVAWVWFYLEQSKPKEESYELATMMLRGGHEPPLAVPAAPVLVAS